MTHLVVGSVPRGADYFGRDELVARLWRRLEYDNVLLVAPRRFGKTGAMYRLLDEPRTPYRPLYINVEHVETPADFMVELMAALRRDRHFARFINALWEDTKEIAKYLRNLASQIDVGGLKVFLREKTDVPNRWLDYGQRIMDQLAEDEPRLLLLLDEVPEMIQHFAKHRPTELEQFLRWFRAVRTAPRTKTRFIISGSINLIATLDTHGFVDAVNDLKVERLEPFDMATARKYIAAVFGAEGITLPPRASAAILRLMGVPIPYLLAVFLTAIIDRHRATGAAITPSMVELVFTTDLFSGASPFFLHYYSRLQDYYAESDARAARAVLSLLSRTDAPVQRETLYQVFLKTRGLPHRQENAEAFVQLMDRLENDFYVRHADGTYEFHSRVIQVWWRNHYGFQEP